MPTQPRVCGLPELPGPLFWGRNRVLGGQPSPVGRGLHEDSVPCGFPQHSGAQRSCELPAQGLQGSNGACRTLGALTGRGGAGVGPRGFCSHSMTGGRW